MNFIDELKKATNKTVTENNAVTNISSLNPVLDFFALAGSMRERMNDAVKLFRLAYAEDALMALRALFYLRDIRGGQGERTLFRECYKTLPSDIQKKYLQHIPTFGRYDDIHSLDVTVVVDHIKLQLEIDEKAMSEGASVSLLAKWLPSENTSSKKTRRLAKLLSESLGLKSSQYRKRIVALRKYIKLLEQKMSANQWGEIDYEVTPSQAMRKHTKAFRRHDEQRFTTYLENVAKGEKKIKTSTLFTYEVFDVVKTDEMAANVMWQNLPDYTQGNNALVVADVSGSMSGRPMSISVSLALYFAEHNKGIFKDYFMTFSAQPQLVRVLGSTLSERLRNIETADWDMNTNVEAAFKAILEAAIANKVNADEIPKVLYFISDMEFDEAVKNPGAINFENAKTMFAAEGFELPHVVFWNVDSKQNQTPATMYDNNVTLISGASQSTFKFAVGGKTPLESMNDILNSERYAVIKLDN